MNLDTEIHNAFQQVKHMYEYRLRWWNFAEWMATNYKIHVGCSDCRFCRDPRADYRDCDRYTDEDRKWQLIAFDDEGLATMFKLKYA
jgi:hypothetical protein